MTRVARTSGMILVVACSLSHSTREDDVPRDAGPDGDAESLDAGRDDTLAPRCQVLPDVCLSHLGTTVLSVVVNEGSTAWGGHLHGLVASERGAWLLYDAEVRPASADPAAGLTHGWQLQELAQDGQPVGEPGTVEDGRVFGADTQGSLSLDDAGLLVTWRQRVSQGGATDRHETWAARVRGESVEVSGPLHVTMPAEPLGDAVGLLSDAATIVVSSFQEGLLFGPLEDPVGWSVPSTPSAGRIAVTAMSSPRAAVAWMALEEPERFPETSARMEGLVISSEGVLAAPQTLLGPVAALPLPSPHILAFGGFVYAARHDRDAQSLRDSRIRVAVLDEGLERSEATDRWFSGWGGLTPRGMALVAWQGHPFLLWRTRDPQYGLHPVLYAEPLDHGPCGIEVGEPVLTWRPHVADDEDFRVAVAGDTMWIAVARVRDEASIDVYRFGGCDD